MNTMRKTYRLYVKDDVIHLYKIHKEDAVLMAFLKSDFVRSSIRIMDMFRMRFSNYEFVVSFYRDILQLRIEYWQLNSK